MFLKAADQYWSQNLNSDLAASRVSGTTLLGVDFLWNLQSC